MQFLINNNHFLEITKFHNIFLNKMSIIIFLLFLELIKQFNMISQMMNLYNLKKKM